MSEYIIKETTLKDIADAVREKTGKSENILVVDIPNEIKNIPSGGGSGDNKFASIVGRTITEVTAEDLAGLTRIGDGAFYSCNSLKNITFPSNITSLGTTAFCLCSSLTRVVMGDSITSIGSAVFQNSGLISVIISRNLKTISTQAFYSCSKLTSVMIPSSVISIGWGAFSGCESLTTITIPSSVTSIDSSALHIGSSTSKATIIMKPTTPPRIQSTTVGSYVEKIRVPKGTLEAYRSATNWSAIAGRIEEEIIVEEQK